MALNKTNTDQFYVLGRFWAVVEMSNGERMSATQVDNLFLNPTVIWRYDRHNDRNTDLRQEILALAPDEGWPQRMLTPVESGRVWLGYYHQKAAIEPKIEAI